MGALVIHDSFHRHRRVVSDRLGNHRRFFGRKYFATIRGTMAFFYTWGGVIGPVVAGAIYDRSESYVATLWGICGLLLLGALLTALLIKPWNAAHEKVSTRYEA